MSVGIKFNIPCRDFEFPPPITQQLPYPQNNNNNKNAILLPISHQHDEENTRAIIFTINILIGTDEPHFVVTDFTQKSVHSEYTTS